MSALDSLLPDVRPAPGTVAPVQATIYKDPMEAAIRTVYAENPHATPEERLAIASVVRNRATAKKKDVGAIAQEPGQFEVWDDPRGRERIDALKKDSPEWKALEAQVGPILRGEKPPVGDYTHFYAPEAQLALGRAKPDWDTGDGSRIGAHAFFTKPYGSNDLGVLTGSGPATDEEADAAFQTAFGNTGDGAKLTAGRTGFKRDPEEQLNASQDKTWQTLNRGGALDPEAPEGSLNNPLVLRKGQTEHDNVGPGEFYVGLDGKFARKPGGDKDSSVTAGLGQGAADVLTSLGHMMPGAQDSTALAALDAHQMQYGAQFGGDLQSGLGRFVGQAGTSAPVLGVGGKVLGPTMRAMGPVGEFLGGQLAKGAAPTLGNVAMRGASLAAAGAGEGAGAGALVSSANDTPFWDQVGAGAVTGGLLKPVGTVVGKGASRFFGPNLTGAAPLSEQQALVARANALPVPVPLSLGDMSGGPAQQMAESALLRGADGDIAAGVMQGFRGDQQGALRGNIQAIAQSMAGGPIERGAGGAAASNKLNSMADAANVEIKAAYQAARDQGENAMLASAKEARDGIIEGLRSNYNLGAIKPVIEEVESLGAEGVPTARQLFEARTRLGNLAMEGKTTGAAAKHAKKALDDYIEKALREDLFLGDPEAIRAWKSAIGKRADFGRLFEGDDLIEGLTERVGRGGGRTLAVPPEEATNLIFNAADMGFVNKSNLGRDLVRLRTVLGPKSDEWNALRAEAFMRIARRGEGATNAGKREFSGANFLKAWGEFSEKTNRVLRDVLFTPEERQLLTDFAEIAQRVTTPVKGGDNPANTAIAAKRFLAPMMQFMAPAGGAAAGGAVGGLPGAAGGAAIGTLFKGLGEILAAGKARNMTYRARPRTADQVANPLGGSALPVAGAILTDRLLGGPSQ